MRKLILIGGPILVLFVVAVWITMRRADSRAPFQPLGPYIVRQESFYVERFNSAGYLETRLWIKGPQLSTRLDDYLKWLNEKQGWIVLDTIAEPNVRAYRGDKILPTESIHLYSAHQDHYRVTYRRDLSGFDDWINRVVRPRQGVNDGPRSLPEGLW